MPCSSYHFMGGDTLGGVGIAQHQHIDGVEILPQDAARRVPFQVAVGFRHQVMAHGQHQHEQHQQKGDDAEGIFLPGL